jgi:hypothetical protein
MPLQYGIQSRHQIGSGIDQGAIQIEQYGEAILFHIVWTTTVSCSITEA